MIKMNPKIIRELYSMIDRERIETALDQGNLNDASILFKYSSLTKQEFEAILNNHPSYRKKQISDNRVWHEILDVIFTKVSNESFDTWFKPTKAEIDDEILTIYCNNTFQRDWLEQRYKEIIEDTALDVTGEKYKVVFALIVNDTKNELHEVCN